MASENVGLVHRWFEEVWNRGDLGVVDELFAADGVARGLGEFGWDVIGPEGFKPFVRRLRGAFPDLRITVEDTIGQGDLVAARFSISMTHEGDDLGVAATGKKIQAQGLCTLRFREGQIVEGWNNWDLHEMMAQLSSDSSGE